MNITQEAKLLKLKGILGNISHASFSYSLLSKKYPLHTLDNRKADEVIRAYEEILQTVTSLITNYERESGMDKPS